MVTDFSHTSQPGNCCMASRWIKAVIGIRHAGMLLAELVCLSLTACSSIIPGRIEVVDIRAFSSKESSTNSNYHLLDSYGPFFRVELDISNLQYPKDGPSPIYEASYCKSNKKYFRSGDVPFLSFLSPQTISDHKLYTWVSSKSLRAATKPYVQLSPDQSLLKDKQDVCIFLDYGSYFHEVSPIIRVNHRDFEKAFSRIDQIN